MMKCHPRIAQGQSPPPRMGCTPVRLASGLFPSLQIINVINNYEDRQYQNHQYHQYQNHQDHPMRKSESRRNAKIDMRWWDTLFGFSISNSGRLLQNVADFCPRNDQIIRSEVSQFLSSWKAKHLFLQLTLKPHYNHGIKILWFIISGCGAWTYLIFLVAPGAALV